MSIHCKVARSIPVESGRSGGGTGEAPTVVPVPFTHASNARREEKLYYEVTRLGPFGLWACVATLACCQYTCTRLQVGSPVGFP